MPISQEIRFQRFESGQWGSAVGSLVSEALVRFHVNGRELVSLMCTPQDLEALALGFLHSEGIIRGRNDIRKMKVCPSGTCVEVWLFDADFEPPTKSIRTSGCGGGVTFAELTEGVEPLVSDLRVAPRQLGRLMMLLQAGQRTRGIHTAALAEGDSLLMVVEDVGRHNAIDKLWGRCLLEGLATEDRILLCTGRLSSEMLNKAARMRAPVVVSRTSPTTLSLALAAAWNITLVGYVRRDSLSVYSGGERVVGDEEAMIHANS